MLGRYRALFLCALARSGRTRRRSAAAPSPAVRPPSLKEIGVCAACRPKSDHPSRSFPPSSNPHRRLANRPSGIAEFLGHERRKCLRHCHSEPIDMGTRSIPAEGIERRIRADAEAPDACVRREGKRGDEKATGAASRATVAAGAGGPLPRFAPAPAQTPKSRQFRVRSRTPSRIHRSRARRTGRASCRSIADS